MSIASGLAIVGAGLAAGTINAIVGSGSLITFPTLLAVGYEPVVANVTNTVGLVMGSISGTIGYRRELEGQAGRIRSLSLASVLGGITGAVLLLVLPGSVFENVVPILILAACVLVAFQPRLAKRMAARQERQEGQAGATRTHSPWLPVTIYATGIYGGYFGAAQGVVLIGLLGIFLDDHLQRLNALKNLLATLVNGVAAVIFVVAAHIAWGAAALLAVGAIAGGQIGAKVGRRIPTPVLRTIIVVVGTGVALRLLLR